MQRTFLSLKSGLSIGFLLSASLVWELAIAGWYSGRITHLAIGYDGTTTVFKIENFNKTNCTCYPTWPEYMCLDRSRPSYKEEFAILMSARARGTAVNPHIDETTCTVVAIYEAGL
jgi:hypothetical protein